MIPKRVMIGQLEVVEGSGTLQALGIGSCVCLIFRSRDRHKVGMAHVLLPETTQGNVYSTETYPARYADRAVKALLEAMGRSSDLEAFLVGGSQMFFRHAPIGGAPVGQRNVEALKDLLSAEKIPVTAEDIGGDKGRTVTVTAEDGKIKVKTVADGAYLVG